MLCYGCHDFFFKGGNCHFKKGKLASEPRRTEHCAPLATAQKHI